MEKPIFHKSDLAHTIYKNAKGKRIPGASTISGGMDKPQLVPWANKLGLQGIDVRNYVDSLARSGTLAHYLAECYLTDRDPEQAYLDEFSKVDRDRADISLIKVMDWKREHPDFKVVLCEVALISEEHQFGGQIDLYGILNGLRVLVDLKTCKALYGKADEKWTQLAGYEIVLVENGQPVDECYILRVGRSEDEGFEFARSPAGSCTASGF